MAEESTAPSFDFITSFTDGSVRDYQKNADVTGFKKWESTVGFGLMDWASKDEKFREALRKAGFKQFPSTTFRDRIDNLQTVDEFMMQKPNAKRDVVTNLTQWRLSQPVGQWERVVNVFLDMYGEVRDPKTGLTQTELVNWYDAQKAEGIDRETASLILKDLTNDPTYLIQFHTEGNVTQWEGVRNGLKTFLETNPDASMEDYDLQSILNDRGAPGKAVYNQLKELFPNHNIWKDPEVEGPKEWQSKDLVSSGQLAPEQYTQAQQAAEGWLSGLKAAFPDGLSSIASPEQRYAVSQWIAENPVPDLNEWGLGALEQMYTDMEGNLTGYVETISVDPVTGERRGAVRPVDLEGADGPANTLLATFAQIRNKLAWMNTTVSSEAATAWAQTDAGIKERAAKIAQATATGDWATLIAMGEDSYSERESRKLNEQRVAFQTAMEMIENPQMMKLLRGTPIWDSVAAQGYDLNSMYSDLVWEKDKVLQFIKNYGRVKSGAEWTNLLTTLMQVTGWDAEELVAIMPEVRPLLNMGGPAIGGGGTQYVSQGRPIS